MDTGEPVRFLRRESDEPGGRGWGLRQNRGIGVAWQEKFLALELPILRRLPRRHAVRFPYWIAAMQRSLLANSRKQCVLRSQTEMPSSRGGRLT